MSSLQNVLREFAEKDKQNKAKIELSNKLKQLKVKNKQLDQQIEAAKKQLSVGKGSENEDPIQNKKNPSVTSEMAQNLFKYAKGKQKLTGLAFMSGVVATSQEVGMLYTFYPYTNGESKGQYNLHLGNRYEVLSHTLPKNAVPLRDLMATHLDIRKEGDDLKTFLRAVFRHLKSYLSRESQIAELSHEGLSEYISDVKKTNNLTDLTITLKVTEQDNDTAAEIEIRLNYEPDKDRPKPGSLQINVSEMWEESLDNLVTQCDALYTSRLKEGLLAAFADA
eukprot:TRINITY_DN3191_c0_g1_i5.p1 TRINITY_DN3191_c0_g1~~TRINITY_DN3191_c0_g1_i5.p1  ORF type:complete len:292 (-),score=61.04 TRINITY_DN3191_c0_g1_i5:10-846(-)